MRQALRGKKSIHGGGLASSLLAVFALIAAGCTTQTPEAEQLAQAKSALTTGWQATAQQMPEQRRYHSATELTSGKVLVVGGWSSSGLVAAARTYDVATSTWSPAGTLTLAREAHTATRLGNGKVLAVGGETFQGANGYTNTAELYDPATNAWSPAGSTSEARGYSTATLLSNNKVLVAGGQSNTPVATVDLYDVATGSWSVGGSMLEARRSHTAVKLSNGKVLVAGGKGWTVFASTELYDPATGKWTAGPAMAAARFGHTATELPNGKILIAGGQKPSLTGGTDFTATAELYDPATNTWAPAGNMASARGFHTATLIAGKVLVAGGRGPGGAIGVSLSSAELYDPATNSWSTTLSMAGAHTDHAAVYSTSVGKVLVLGGSNDVNAPSAVAELYTYDSCTGVTCNTPPGQCYASTGTCSNGSCTYAPLSSGTACNDGDACTSGDTCNGAGGCTSGTQTCSTCDPSSCSRATSYSCSGDDVWKTTGTGTCSGDSCGSIDTFVKTCPSGTTYGAWSACSGFDGTCGEWGTQTRTVTERGCSDGACTSSSWTETQACSRNTEGASCGATTSTAWSACFPFARDVCDEGGAQDRYVYTYTCSSGSCQESFEMQWRDCSINTDGVSCGGTTYGAWSECSADACGGTGTQTREVTTPSCSGGACGGSTTTETQSCTKPTVSCPNGQQCSGGTCVAIDCGPGYSYCNGGCIPTDDDFNNCGGCGIRCPNFKFQCIAGVCEYT